MSDLRDPGVSVRRQSRARYRCNVCARFVVATEYGVCPHCGMGPPTLPGELQSMERGESPHARLPWILAAGLAVIAVAASLTFC